MYVSSAEDGYIWTGGGADWEVGWIEVLPKTLKQSSMNENKLNLAFF